MKDNEFSLQAFRAMAVIALVVGLFVTVAAPLLIQSTLTALMVRVAEQMTTNPEFKLTAIMLPIWFFLFMGIDIVAGIMLILLSRPLSRGASWAWPYTLLCLAFPSIFGVFTSLPYLVQYGKPAPAALLLLVSLAGYFWVLFLKKGDKLDKFARFLVFTALGVVPGHIIVLVNHGIKNLISRPEHPLFTNLETTVYGFEAPVNFISFLFCIIAIPLLAARKESGWYLGLAAGIAVTFVNFPTHFIRMETSDFFVAGLLGLLLTILLAVPACKKRLLEGLSEDEARPSQSALKSMAG